MADRKTDTFIVLPDTCVVAVDHLAVQFATSERTVEAVRDLPFHVDRGQTLAIVGESGSGKSVTRVEKVESAPNPDGAPARMYYAGGSSSTAESDWAPRPLLASESFPPKMPNTAYYKNDQVDGDIAKALLATDHAEKFKLYKDAQERICKDAPRVFLATQKILYARSKNISVAYVMYSGRHRAARTARFGP